MTILVLNLEQYLDITNHGNNTYHIMFKGIKIQTVTFKNNKEEGAKIYYYDNNKIWIINNYHNGKKHGDCKEWYINNKIKKIEKYNNGVLLSKEEHYDDEI